MSVDQPFLTGAIEALFLQHGKRLYDGARQEPITALEHALQCAQLAEWAHADATLVAAALLHDVGHFLVDEGFSEHDDDTHEERVVPFLRELGFDRAVTEPIRLHVLAKRYLVRVDADYAGALSRASQHTLSLQGGPMTDAEMLAFDELPFAGEALQLRRWDDMAKVPAKRTPPLDYYLSLLGELLAEGEHGPRTDIGTFGMV